MLEGKHGEKCVNPISMCQHEEKLRRDANELKIPQPQRNVFVYFYLDLSCNWLLNFIVFEFSKINKQN